MTKDETAAEECGSSNGARAVRGASYLSIGDRHIWNSQNDQNREAANIQRDVIDHLVDVCRNGQGQIAARRVRAAVWNANASAEFLHDQHEINLFLGRMAATDRDILAQLLAKEVELGVFESLKALEQF